MRSKHKSSFHNNFISGKQKHKLFYHCVPKRLLKYNLLVVFFVFYYCFRKRKYYFDRKSTKKCKKPKRGTIYRSQPLVRMCLSKSNNILFFKLKKKKVWVRGLSLSGKNIQCKFDSIISYTLTPIIGPYSTPAGTISSQVLNLSGL